MILLKDNFFTVLDNFTLTGTVINITNAYLAVCIIFATSSFSNILVICSTSICKRFNSDTTSVRFSLKPRKN